MVILPFSSMLAPGSFDEVSDDRPLVRGEVASVEFDRVALMTTSLVFPTTFTPSGGLRPQLGG